MKINGLAWVYSTTNCGAEFITFTGKVTNIVGTEDYPYSSKQFNEMLEMNTWEGAYVRINNKTVFANKFGNFDEDPYGCGCGCGCGCNGNESGSGSGSGSDNSGSGIGRVKAGEMTCFVKNDFIERIRISWTNGITYTPTGSLEGVSLISCECLKTIDDYVYHIDMENNSNNTYLKWTGTYKISGRVPYRVYVGTLYKNGYLEVDVYIPGNFQGE